MARYWLSREVDKPPKLKRELRGHGAVWIARPGIVRGMAGVGMVVVRRRGCCFSAFVEILRAV